MASIYDSFNQQMPEFQLFGTQESLAHISGATTKQCTPPMCSVETAVSHWNQLASRRCLEPFKDALEKEHLPEVEKLIGLKSEGDVVNASTQYFTHPVHIGYQALYPDDCYLNEVTKPGRGETHTSRVDRAYFLGKPENQNQPGESSNIFAVLEYKKFGAIDRDEFQRGTVTDYETHKEAHFESRYVDVEEDNIVVLLKQAVHYAWRYDTPFVALCDYKTLVLLCMTRQKGGIGGPHVYMTIVEGESKDMRKAYLGSLLAARSHAEGKTDWRLNEAQQDIFLEADNWWQQFAPPILRRNPDRAVRKKDPKHDSSGSQRSNVLMQ